ncbi:BICD family-like cargo adapter 1 [Periophthalmus magnuspinnatus]|uniref:BICD family-like cargo adapter 1 n=1 Tax=Periophthalmus magnuspinnatus TaxID=409849 RepID=UPI002436E054|nr:BICD family-like cargo adapter 1 [Periophthalmus magnuspinnatus]
MDILNELSFKSKNMDLEEEDFYYDYGAEEITDYQDPSELVAALKQKEEEVILAAQLGNALLLENQQLKEQSEQLHERYADKLEELEQKRHELQVKLEGCRSQWESQVGDLERDARELSARVEHLTLALNEAERNKTRAEMEHGEDIQRLKDQLNAAMEVERVMSSELQALKQELQQKTSQNRQQDEELISAMKEQVLRLTQKEQTLEERLENVCHENAELRTTLASLNARLSLQEQLNQQQSQQLAEAWEEVEAVRGHSHQLQAQVEELQEEVSLQEAKSQGDASLLSELESSLITANLGVDREEGLNQPFVGQACESQNAAEKLRDQNIQLQNENAELMQKLQCIQSQANLVQQAIKDRDEAIARKNMMEAELVRSKNDMMCLNNQLLEAIQRKLELSQELEAWQDDIQIILNQQLKSQQQSEQVQNKTTSNGLSFFRRPNRISNSTWSPDSNGHKAQSPWRDWLRRGKGAQYGK